MVKKIRIFNKAIAESYPIPEFNIDVKIRGTDKVIPAVYYTELGFVSVNGNKSIPIDSIEWWMSTHIMDDDE